MIDQFTESMIDRLIGFIYLFIDLFLDQHVDIGFLRPPVYFDRLTAEKSLVNRTVVQ